jgi:hypothetical protein
MPKQAPQTIISQTIIDTAKAALRRDPKRAGIMGALGLVMLILWGRMLLGGPATVTATSIRRSIAPITDSTTALAKPTGTSPLVEWLGKPKQAVSRNLFAIPQVSYSRAGTNGPAPDAEDAVGSAQAAAMDAKIPLEILLENLKSEAARLKLQGTMIGSAPRAIVNGEILKEGDVIAGFVVTRILPREILLQHEGVLLEISMP